MKILYLCLGLVSLLLGAGCGSNNGGVPGFIPKGNFSNASLNGQYVYQIEGFDFSNPNNVVPYREAGVFTANGNKVITSATDDFSEGTGVLNTYTVAPPPGTADFALNTLDSSADQYAVAWLDRAGQDRE